MGELIPGNTSNQDAAFMPFISSANISCGAHSGTIELIENTIRHAVEHKLRIGAHPSYPDKENFGRKSMAMEPSALKETITNQIHFLQQQTKKYNTHISYIKPHGALYNDIAYDDRLAHDFIKTIQEINPKLKIMGLAGSPLQTWVNNEGMEFISEVFADRTYTPSLKLKSRKEPDALITSEEKMMRQLSRFINQEVEDDQGQIHPIKCDSICFHSDTPNALSMIEAAYHFLINKNLAIASD